MCLQYKMGLIHIISDHILDQPTEASWQEPSDGDVKNVCDIAVWVKADWVQKSEMIVLLKVKTIPTFLCNPENMNHWYLKQF